MTYQDIANANKNIKYTDIKGKNYAMVAMKVQAFRSLYPEGFISTDLISNDGGVAVMRTTVGYYTEQGEKVILATGMAYEKEENGYINKTSYIENCETSAVGRALAFVGIGSEEQIASTEELLTAMGIQEKEKQKMEARKEAAKNDPRVKAAMEETGKSEAVEGKKWDKAYLFAKLKEQLEINDDTLKSELLSLYSDNVIGTAHIEEMTEGEAVEACKAIKAKRQNR